MPADRKRPYLNASTAAAIIAATVLPRPQELPDALVDFLGRTIAAPGDSAWATFQGLRSAIGAPTPGAAQWAIFAARDLGLIGKDVASTLSGTTVQMTLSAQGWARFDKMQRQRPDSKRAFWASKWGEPELDRLVDHFLRPAVKATGFDLVRLDDAPRAGLIDDKLRVEIRRSRFLIADLTHANNGAYWEAGFAEGIGLPVIYTCSKEVFESEDKKPHFDTNHHLAVVWNPTNLLTAAEQLKAVIRATLPAEADLEDKP